MPERFKGDGYWELVTRQMSVVSKSEQKRFKEAKIAVIGCGGLGGTIIEMLARMGVGELVLVDKDCFDLSNINRQLLSDFSNLGLSKVEVAKERVRLINPYVKTAIFNEELNENNVSAIIKNCDVVVDGLDNILTRIILSRECQTQGIPFVHGAIHGTLGEVTVFLPDGEISYEEIFNIPSKNKELSDEVIGEVLEIYVETPPVIGPIVSFIGSIQAMEAFKLISGIGDVIKAPEIYTVDLLDLKSSKVN